MRPPVIDTDYLVIGAGATGLAFADTLLDESDAHITIVDRHGKPGGHWNDAYPFVTLHQPSAFYGVNSTELGSGRKDTTGLNAGLYELATGAEVCGYYDRVVGSRLVPSGRVTHLPMSEHEGAGRVRSLLSGAVTEVRVRRKVVDATYNSPSVPSTHTPSFTVAPGVRLVPPNALPGLGNREQELPTRFTVLGGGKTAMDTCVWLVTSGADPDAITWVVPRDSWLIDRGTTQPAPEFFDEVIGGQADQMAAFAAATSTEDLFLRLEACGALTRIDRERTPGMFHLATVAPGEVEVLRRIRDVVRLGRVRALEPDRTVLDGGEVATAPDTLFVDCTASAVRRRPVQPVFQGDRIVLQMLRLPQPAFSAALTAWVEAHRDDEEQQNRLCGPVAFPHALDDYAGAMATTLWNQFHWTQDRELRRWIRGSRLDGFSRLVAGVARDDAHGQAVLARYREQAVAAVGNLPNLTATAR
ncbi:Pyridine nucleotide-disulphide oxidoreductase [Geodermatophilus dictyosporus]|uniref:Pyridine nucleotide-disulphide oxidoreductase n=1 Tax=Geodermatophilus dictyosporus TaxID=1523247 RepID=A0A1I5THM7_9ACTN|nr:FAD/NAD(P)-binding protein [Geodermatophilus dictyosporus]SFP82525.1 Pyridine nucleotide-disulphide oxidoreductase [Geodermatophilus dictyosporus]